MSGKGKVIYEEHRLSSWGTWVDSAHPTAPPYKWVLVPARGFRHSRVPTVLFVCCVTHSPAILSLTLKENRSQFLNSYTRQRSWPGSGLPSTVEPELGGRPGSFPATILQHYLSFAFWANQLLTPSLRHPVLSRGRNLEALHLSQACGFAPSPLRPNREENSHLLLHWGLAVQSPAPCSGSSQDPTYLAHCCIWLCVPSGWAWSRAGQPR